MHAYAVQQRWPHIANMHNNKPSINCEAKWYTSTSNYMQMFMTSGQAMIIDVTHKTESINFFF